MSIRKISIATLFGATLVLSACSTPDQPAPPATPEASLDLAESMDPDILEGLEGYWAQQCDSSDIDTAAADSSSYTSFTQAARPSEIDYILDPELQPGEMYTDTFHVINEVSEPEQMTLRGWFNTEFNGKDTVGITVNIVDCHFARQPFAKDLSVLGVDEYLMIDESIVRSVFSEEDIKSLLRSTTPLMGPHAGAASAPGKTVDWDLHYDSRGFSGRNYSDLLNMYDPRWGTPVEAEYHESYADLDDCRTDSLLECPADYETVHDYQFFVNVVQPADLYSHPPASR